MALIIAVTKRDLFWPHFISEMVSSMKQLQKLISQCYTILHNVTSYLAMLHDISQYCIIFHNVAKTTQGY